MPLAEAVAELLEVGDLLDGQLRLRLEAFREGWRAAELAHADDYSRGYGDGVLALKDAQHAAAEALRPPSRRWELRGQARTRATFSQPHPKDFKGLGAA